MDNESESPRRRYPAGTGKLSKTPSWVMLGFVLGAVTVASLPPWRKEKPAPAAMAAKEPPVVKRETPKEPPRISTIEAVFDEWKAYAVWDFNTTEVALWNSETKEYSDYFEVLRYADRHYFRSLPVLTRRVIARGPELPNCPLKFTETEEQYRIWRETGRTTRPFGDHRPLSAFEPAAAEAPARPTIARPDMAPPKLEAIAPFEPPAIKPAESKK
jgi:hypothetical protein